MNATTEIVFIPSVARPEPVEGARPTADDVSDQQSEVSEADAADPPPPPALSAAEGTAEFRRLTPDEQRELKSLKDALDCIVRQDILIELCVAPPDSVNSFAE